MKSEEIKKRFFNFFEKKHHKILPSVSLVSPDPTVLFTTAGMQPLVEYLAGMKDPLKDFGTRHLASCQKCLRTNDIFEVGDDTHHTFFEMLGNWSIGVDEKGYYFKKGAIELALEFLVNELGLKKEKMKTSVFKGENGIGRDITAIEIWQKLGIKKIEEYGREDNFWGPVGKTGPCGPCSEIYYLNQKTGKFVEIWNLVFMEYFQDEKGNLKKLNQTNVDTGIGFERLVAVLQKKESAYETDLFLPTLKILAENSKAHYEKLKREFRIVLDHLRASVFLISDGVFPSNLAQGYVLRRILRRSFVFLKRLEFKDVFLIVLIESIIKNYQKFYENLAKNKENIVGVIENEKEKFSKTLEGGLKLFQKEVERLKSKNLQEFPGEVAFDLYQSYGFPLELTIELAQDEKMTVDQKGFQIKFKEHQEISRKSSERKFGGHGVDKITKIEEREKVTKLHTATHLLHAALREILGSQVQQMGSDISPERLRFDFSFPRKLSQDEIVKIENLVNQKIKEDIKVEKREMSLEEALQSGALAFFKEKYPPKVMVYTIGNFSKEICSGPHVERTSQVGKFKIIKEEGLGKNVRRIRAIVE